jgi:hypothetical protein
MTKRKLLTGIGVGRRIKPNFEAAKSVPVNVPELLRGGLLVFWVKSKVGKKNKAQSARVAAAFSVAKAGGRSARDHGGRGEQRFFVRFSGSAGMFF